MKVKAKRTFGWFLEFGMFYLMLVSFIVCFILIGGSLENYYDVDNVGWQWDFLSWSYLSFNFWIIYLIGFLIILVFNRKTNKFLSRLFYISSLSLVLLEQVPHLYELFPYLWLYSLMYNMRMLLMLLFFVIFLQAIFSPKMAVNTKKIKES